jgi:Skp family chaperone for outer membrane proteins
MRSRLAAMMMLALLTGVPAAAQEAEPLDAAAVLVINQEKLFTGSALGRMVIGVDDREKGALADLGESLSVQLEAEEKALTEKRKTMDAAEFRKLADEFDTRVVEIRADQDRKAEALVNAIDARRRQFYNQIAPAMLEIIQKYGASVILDQRSVIISIKGINVTDELIALIDTRYKSLADIGITE